MICIHKIGHLNRPSTTYLYFWRSLLPSSARTRTYWMRCLKRPMSSRSYRFCWVCVEQNNLSGSCVKIERCLTQYRHAMRPSLHSMPCPSIHRLRSCSKRRAPPSYHSNFPWTDTHHHPHFTLCSHHWRFAPHRRFGQGHIASDQ